MMMITIMTAIMYFGSEKACAVQLLLNERGYMRGICVYGLACLPSSCYNMIFTGKRMRSSRISLTLTLAVTHAHPLTHFTLATSV